MGGHTETMEEQSRNNSVALGQGPLPQGIGIAISLSSSAELKPPINEDVNYLMKHSSFQREGYSWRTLRTTEAHQETT